MGLHTWFYNKVEADKSEMLQYTLNSIELEMEYDSDNYYYYWRILDWFNKGWISTESLLDEFFYNEYSSSNIPDVYSKKTDSFYSEAIGFHDCFRTTKREKDGTYTLDKICSKEECDKWLEDNKETIYYLNKEYLNEFWTKYPDGMIDFG